MSNMEEKEQVESVKKSVPKKKKKDEKIGEALLKVALGYQIAEVTEEYAEVDGALKLTKRKKTKKDIPPDLKAVQLLLASGEGAEYSQWSDEALEKEKKRLLAQLQAQAVAAGVAGLPAVEAGSVPKEKTKKTAKKATKKVATKKK